MIQGTSLLKMASSVMKSSSRQLNTKVYELRQYALRPDSVVPFQILSNEQLHLRTSHSNLIGYWQNELGGLNNVFHIWEYESIEDRARVRNALGQDEFWKKKYLSLVAPMLLDQKNSLCHLLKGDNFQALPDSGAYQSFEVTFSPQTSQQGQQSAMETFYNQLKSGATSGNMALFETLLGNRLKYWVLAHYKQMNDILEDSAMKLPSDAVVTSRMMLPWAWNSWTTPC